MPLVMAVLHKLPLVMAVRAPAHPLHRLSAGAAPLAAAAVEAEAIAGAREQDLSGGVARRGPAVRFLKYFLRILHRAN
jgi:hypothetical protein